MEARHLGAPLACQGHDGMRRDLKERQHMNVIEAREVVKRYGDFTAVDGVNFTVQSGEFFGLLGAMFKRCVSRD